MSKRQGGKLHNLHIRLPENDYLMLKEACDSLGITIADYYNQLLRSDGYDSLIKYAKMVSKDPRQVEICFADNETKERVTELTQALISAADQTRKIGWNVSNLIRDIRRGRVDAKEAIPLLEEIKDLVENQTANYQATGGKLEELIFSDEGIWRVKIVEKVIRTPDDYSWYDDEDTDDENGGDG